MRKQFQVTGVFKDIPRNSHLKFEAAFSNAKYFKILEFCK